MKRPASAGDGNFFEGAVITVSSRLLAGGIRDANAPFISEWLGKHAGLTIVRFITVPNDKAAVQDALRYVRDHASCKIAFVAGGLGVTAEDVTKPAIAEFFGCPEMRRDEESERLLVERREANNTEVTDLHRALALVPRDSEVLMNPCGLAPGFALHEADRYTNSTDPRDMLRSKGFTVVGLPGVPRELSAMTRTSVTSYLQQRFKSMVPTCITFGVDVDLHEAATTEVLQEWIDQLPANTTVTVCPSRVTVTVKDFDAQSANRQVARERENLVALLRPWLVLRNDNDDDGSGSASDEGSSSTNE